MESSIAHEGIAFWTVNSPSSLRTRLAALDEEVIALDEPWHYESKLRVLATERRTIMNHLGYIIYPILSIPPEITGQIFSHYVGMTRPRIPSSATWGRHGPLVLASVCMQWRDICLSLRSLWSCLEVEPPHKSSENLLNLLQCWLSRAGSHPLDLEVSEWHTVPRSTMLPFLTLVCQYSSQWQSISLTSIPHGKTMELPRLMKLKIYNEVDIMEPITVFSVAPLLRHVTIAGLSSQSLPLPWRQIIHLDLSHQSVARCLQTLKEAPNLESLVVESYWGIKRPVLPFTLSRLRTLTVRPCRSETLLEHLTLPALTTLVLRRVDIPFPLVRDISLRSMWPLHTLRLVQMPLETIMGWLRCNPFLENVEIFGPKTKAGFAPLVSGLTTDTSFLPALRTLTIKADGVSIDAKAVAKMLVSRRDRSRDAVAMLNSFRFFSSVETYNAASFNKLTILVRPLVNDGLEVLLGALPKGCRVDQRFSGD
ncbi:hypothetical protein C8R43DRAFT_960905 [Mycena crocata]|nr:hypothetical protein C8R43DRAFT_960905 [Mycena crocata]